MMSLANEHTHNRFTLSPDNICSKIRETEAIQVKQGRNIHRMDGLPTDIDS